MRKRHLDMKSALSAVALLAIILDLSVVGFLIYAEFNDRDWLIVTRAALFTELSSHEDIFRADPSQAKELGFATDSPSTRKHWREILLAEVEYVEGWLAMKGPSIERAKALIPLISRDGADTTLGTHRCGEAEFDGLIDTLQRIGTDHGYGCCSDHTQSFLALTSIADIEAREVANAYHVVAEFYSPELAKWVYIDPQFALMASGPDGEPLSLLELRESYRDGEEFQFDFIGNTHHRFHDSDPRDDFFYNEPSDLETYNVTWGNDVFGQAEFNESLSGLPTSARQALALLTRQMPPYLALRDENDEFQQTLIARRRLCLGILGALVLTNGTLPFWIAARRKSAESTPRI